MYLGKLMCREFMEVFQNCGKGVQCGNEVKPKFIKQSPVIHSQLRHIRNSDVVLPCHAPDIRGSKPFAALPFYWFFFCLVGIRGATRVEETDKGQTTLAPGSLVLGDLGTSRPTKCPLLA